MYSNVLFDGTYHGRYAPTSFFPLLASAASDAQAVAMMATLTAPTGFCVNTSYTPHPSAQVVSAFWDGTHDNAACASPWCTKGILEERVYTFVRPEAAVVGMGGGGCSTATVPLFHYYSAAYGDHALTANSTVPDSTYVLVAQEGWCFRTAAAASAASGNAYVGGSAWPSTPLTLWWSPARRDLQTCGSPLCVAAAVTNGYVQEGGSGSALCYAWNATGATNMPCTQGLHSIARADPSWGDNSYWRGRVWGPHYALVYWGLQKYDHVPSVRAARLELVAQGKALLLSVWRLFRQIPENVNGVFGFPEDVPNADAYYHWGCLFGYIALLEAGVA